MDCEFSFLCATSHFLSAARRCSFFLPSPPPILRRHPSRSPPPFHPHCSQQQQQQLAEAVVENKSKWRGHCPNHLAAVGCFLLAMHTYVMPRATNVGTRQRLGRGGRAGRATGGQDLGERGRGSSDLCLGVTLSSVGLFYDMRRSSGDKALKMGQNKGIARAHAVIGGTDCSRPAAAGRPMRPSEGERRFPSPLSVAAELPPSQLARLGILWTAVKSG